MSEILQKCTFGVRHRLPMPSEVSPEGHVQIRNLVIRHLESRYGTISLQRVDEAFENIGLKWKAKEGAYTKRLAKYFYKWGWELPPEIIQEAGNIARNNSADEGTVYVFDFTDDFNWEAGDFGDDGSCFWGGRSIARRMIKGMGGIAIRFWSKDDDDKGIGRAWIIPVDYQYSDYETTSDGPAVRMVNHSAPMATVFNSYGLDILVTTRVLSTFLGMSYKKIRLVNNGYTDDVLYINGSGNGYAVAMPSILERVETVELHANAADYQPICSMCGAPARATREFDGRDLCGRCYDHNVGYCTQCGDAHWRDGMYNLNGNMFCDTCWNNDDVWYICDHCNERTWISHRYDAVTAPGVVEHWCYSCATSLRRCDHCNRYAPADVILEQRSHFAGYSNHVCPDCAQTHHTCDVCGGVWSEVERMTVTRRGETREVNACQRCARRERETAEREQRYAAEMQRRTAERQQTGLGFVAAIEEALANNETTAPPMQARGDTLYVTVTLTAAGDFTVEERRT